LKMVFPLAENLRPLASSSARASARSAAGELLCIAACITTASVLVLKRFTWSGVAALATGSDRGFRGWVMNAQSSAMRSCFFAGLAVAGRWAGAAVGVLGAAVAFCFSL